MKRVFIALALVTSVSLGGCAQLRDFSNKVSTAFEVVTNAAVTPQQIIIAANSFDIAKASVTQYLIFCKTHAQLDACALPIRQKVVAYVRTGTVTRNQLETYAAQGKAGPIELYNTLRATVDALQTNTPKVGG